MWISEGWGWGVVTGVTVTHIAMSNECSLCVHLLGLHGPAELFVRYYSIFVGVKFLSKRNKQLKNVENHTNTFNLNSSTALNSNLFAPCKLTNNTNKCNYTMHNHS